MGLTVIAGCLSEKSKGANLLRNLNPPFKPKIRVKQLDLTIPESISKMKTHVQEVLSDSDAEFYALVNNAGFMVFGECEWLTPSLVNRQLDVNLRGMITFTHTMLPLMREASQKNSNLGCRIINVTSHCSKVALPGLSVYSASKVGAAFFTSSLRLDMKQYNVKVINFIPGSFVLQSGILNNQRKFGDQMWNGLDEKQKEFYGDYFHRYQNYIGGLSDMTTNEVVEVDYSILKAFKEAATEESPKRTYTVEPMRYKFYYGLFKILPDCEFRDYLMTHRFTQFPRYRK